MWVVEDDTLLQGDWAVEPECLRERKRGGEREPEREREEKREKNISLLHKQRCSLFRLIIFLYVELAQNAAQTIVRLRPKP